MNDHDARMLTAWFDANEVRGSDGSLDRAVAVAKATAQRPGWLVRLRGGTIAADDLGRGPLALPMLAGTALVAVLVAGALVGGFVFGPPTPSPVQPGQTARPSPTPSAALGGRSGLVAFTHVDVLDRGVQCPNRTTLSCYLQRLWISHPDGSDAHELLPGVEGRQIALGWSPDGRWLLFDADGVPTLTDATGSEVRPLNSARSTDLGKGVVAFSPDSTRLAFIRDINADAPDDGGELAILDIASGKVVVLESTRFREVLGDLAWSPDGAWIAYDEMGLSIPGRIFLVSPDGRDRRALTPEGLSAIDPHWSRDGSSLVFTSTVKVWTGDTVTSFVNNIYRLPLAERSPIQLTSDGNSARPSWTLDGRIAFIRTFDEEAPVSGFELWVMDADGSNPQPLDAANLAALSEIGCVVCTYPPMPPESEIWFDDEAFWQPTP